MRKSRYNILNLRGDPLKNVRDDPLIREISELGEKYKDEIASMKDRYIATRGFDNKERVKREQIAFLMSVKGMPPQKVIKIVNGLFRYDVSESELLGIENEYFIRGRRDRKIGRDVEKLSKNAYDDPGAVFKLFKDYYDSLRAKEYVGNSNAVLREKYAMNPQKVILESADGHASKDVEVDPKPAIDSATIEGGIGGVEIRADDEQLIQSIDIEGPKSESHFDPALSEKLGNEVDILLEQLEDDGTMNKHEGFDPVLSGKLGNKIDTLLEKFGDIEAGLPRILKLKPLATAGLSANTPDEEKINQEIHATLRELESYKKGTETREQPAAPADNVPQAKAIAQDGTLNQAETAAPETVAPEKPAPETAPISNVSSFENYVSEPTKIKPGSLGRKLPYIIVPILAGVIYFLGGGSCPLPYYKSHRVEPQRASADTTIPANPSYQASLMQQLSNPENEDIVIIAKQGDGLIKVIEKTTGKNIEYRDNTFNLVAKKNGLKYPFTLEFGQEIKIPSDLNKK